MKTISRFVWHPIAILFLTAAAPAAELITATITLTNNPAGLSSNLTVNGSTRSWTNDVSSSPGTLIQQTNTIPLATTNLLNHLTAFRPAGVFFLTQSSPTNVALRGGVGTAMSVTVAGGWASVTYSTQTVASPTILVRVPMTVEAPTNRTNIASQLVQGLSDYSNVALATNSTALSNALIKGASPPQYVLSEVQFQSILRAAIEVAFTNGYMFAVTNINPVFSNAVNYGNAIRSEGSGGNSLQVGSNALGSGALSVALGNSSVADGPSSLAVGTGAIATNSGSIAIGNLALATNASGTAIGVSATARGSQATVVGFSGLATGDNGTALGAGSISRDNGTTVGINSEARSNNAAAFGPAAFAGHVSALALGANATAIHSNAVAIAGTTTAADQIRLGAAAHTVSIPGVLAVSGTQSDTVFSGTTKFDLAISYSRTNITSLANGANDVDPGFKTYLKVSGPSAAYSIDKIDRGYDGRVIIIQKTDSLTLTIPNNSGAGVLGDEAKILTGTGGTLTITNNPGFVELIYDSAALRWGVIRKSN